MRSPRGLRVRIATTVSLPIDGAGRPHNHNQLHRPPPSAMAHQHGGKSGAECLRTIATHLPSPSENPWSRRRCPEKLWCFELGPKAGRRFGPCAAVQFLRPTSARASLSLMINEKCARVREHSFVYLLESRRRVPAARRFRVYAAPNTTIAMGSCDYFVLFIPSLCRWLLERPGLPTRCAFFLARPSAIRNNSFSSHISFAASIAHMVPSPREWLLVPRGR
jgi:hypothetical protein